MRDLPSLLNTEELYHVLPSISSELTTQPKKQAKILHLSECNKGKMLSSSWAFPRMRLIQQTTASALCPSAHQPHGRFLAFQARLLACGGGSLMQKLESNCAFTTCERKADSGHSGSPNLSADVFSASQLCDISLSANKARVITLAGRGDTNRVGNAYFLHHISQLSVILLHGILLTVLTTQRVELLNPHAPHMAFSSPWKGAKPEPCFARWVTLQVLSGVMQTEKRWACKILIEGS